MKNNIDIFFKKLNSNFSIKLKIGFIIIKILKEKDNIVRIE